MSLAALSGFHAQMFQVMDSNDVLILRARPAVEPFPLHGPQHDLYFGSTDGKNFWRLSPFTPAALQDPAHWAVTPSSGTLEEGLRIYFDAPPPELEATPLFQGLIKAYETHLELTQNLRAFAAEFAGELKTVTSLAAEADILCKTEGASPFLRDMHHSLMDIISTGNEITAVLGDPETTDVPSLQKGASLFYEHLSGRTLMSTQSYTYALRNIIHLIKNDMSAPMIAFDIVEANFDRIRFDSLLSLANKISAVYNADGVTPDVDLAGIVTQHRIDAACAGSAMTADPVSVIETAEKILIVEDDPQVSSALVSFLKKCGFQNVLSAADAEEAESLIQTHAIHFVVLDYNLGLKDQASGADLAAKMARSGTKFFFHTGNVSGLKADLTTRGLADFPIFSKGENLSLLVNALRRSIFKK